MFSVIIADDEGYVLTGLRTLIPWQTYDCEIAGEASNGRELIDMINARGADIAILDIRMPGVNGIEASEVIKRTHPETVLIFLTGYEDFSFARAAVNVGAAAYIVKTDVLEELPAALKKAVDTLKKSRVPPEPEAMIALLRALSDGTYALRRSEDAFVSAYQRLADGFSASRLLAAEFEKPVSGLELANVKLLLESSFRRFSPALFPMEGTRLCLLLRGADVKPEEIAPECARLLPVAEGFCGLKIAMAFSDAFTDIADMRAAYTQIAGMLSQRLRDGDARILYAAPVSQRAPKFLTAENGLSSLLTDGEAAEADAWLDSFIASIRGMDLLRARGECLRALSEMAAVCYHYDKQLSPPGGCDYNAAVLSASTLSALKDAVSAALCQCRALIRREDEKIHILIKATDEYIAVHAYEKVSLADIANAVHVNPSHLSRFYKEKTGKNLFDVINALRVQKAAELMRKTDLRTYEIADRVGFSDTSNFSKFFKKHTGLTPRDFTRGRGRKS